MLATTKLQNWKCIPGPKPMECIFESDFYFKNLELKLFLELWSYQRLLYLLSKTKMRKYHEKIHIICSGQIFLTSHKNSLNGEIARFWMKNVFLTIKSHIFINFPLFCIVRILGFYGGKNWKKEIFYCVEFQWFQWFQFHSLRNEWG